MFHFVLHLASLVLMTLKLTGYIAVPWLAVFIPSIISITILLLLIALLIFIGIKASPGPKVYYGNRRIA